MTLDEIILKLKQRFVLVDTIDLLTEKSLFTRLSLFNNKIFEERERLVIVADSQLPKTYDNFPADALSKLQEYTRYYNIPHSFIIILSDIPTIKEDLKKIHRVFYYQESDPINMVISYSKNS